MIPGAESSSEKTDNKPSSSARDAATGEPVCHGRLRPPGGSGGRLEIGRRLLVREHDRFERQPAGEIATSFHILRPGPVNGLDAVAIPAGFGHGIGGRGEIELPVNERKQAGDRNFIQPLWHLTGEIEFGVRLDQRRAKRAGDDRWERPGETVHAFSRLRAERSPVAGDDRIPGGQPQHDRRHRVASFVRVFADVRSG